VLGVTADSSAEDVRRAYRALMRRHHPDIARNDPAATARAAELTSAYALLAGHVPPEPARRSTPPPPDPPPHAQVRADGAIIVEAPGNETFLRVLDALETVGDVTYRDRSAGFLQAMYQPPGGPLCTMAVAIEPRSVDTLVLLALDPMDGSAVPPIEPLLHELATLIHEG
jgi:hypothetical protein